MPRQIEEYKTHHLPDVSEESEYDLWSDRFGSWIGRSSKSKSPDSFKHLRYDRKSSSGVSSASPDYFEATGRRSSSDHGHNDLTTDTDSFMIGNRVYVGGVKPGRITFIGEVHFAPGEWAGVVLDEPEGKNDGAVSGKRYFQCEPKKGIFSRLTRLTREPLRSSQTPDGFSSMDTSLRSMTSPGRSGNTSPTYSVTSTSKVTKNSAGLEINDRVIVKSATGSRVGVLRYIGEPQFASGIWCGVEFKEPAGKNDGSVAGVRYFKCEPGHGIFVPEAKVALSPIDRKNRLSRANSQESLVSNMTLGSIASTNTSKLRLNATQKRLSSLNKSPAATSTPKPSFSLQDILREKTTHIDQLLKEREADRDDMQTQSMLYQKNVSLYKDKISILEAQLLEEKKKSEDLQFRVEESEADNAESNVTVKKLKDQIGQLQNELSAVKGAGDNYVPSQNLQQTEEIENLRKQLEETSKKLHTTEDLKKTLENEIQSLHEKVTEVNNDLELKISGAAASEACLKDEMNYLEKRVNDLELELGEKAKVIEAQKNEAKKIEALKIEEIGKLSGEIQEKSVAESNLLQKIAEKEEELEKLKKIVESLSSSDAGAKELLEQLQSDLAGKTESLATKDFELENLQKSLESTKLEMENFRKSSENQVEEMKSKENSNQELNKKNEILGSEISVLRMELERFQNSLKDTDAAILTSQEIEKNLKLQISELTESKVKLEEENLGKQMKIVEIEGKLENSIKEVEEKEKCINGLEAEVKSINMKIQEKQVEIENSVKNQEEMKTLNEKLTREVENLKSEFENIRKTNEENAEKLKKENENEKSTLNSKIEDLTRSGKEKDSILEKSEKNVDLLNELKSSLEEKLAARENELKEITTKLNKAERDDAEKTSQLEKLQKSFEEITIKFQEAEIISKTLQQEKDSLEVDRNDLNRKLGAFEEKVSQLNEQKSKLQQELDSAKSSSMDINSEVSKLNSELKIKQEAFESFQTEAETAKLTLERRVDELERQNGLVEQQNVKLLAEMEALQTQKIESENQLNQELQNIKQSSDEEKAELEQELSKTRNNFETANLQLTRENQSLKETFEKCREELENKIRDLENTISGLESEVEKARSLSRENESSMTSVVNELKKKEAEVAAELEGQRQKTDELKKSLEELETSKEILKNEYEEKIQIHKNKIEKLDEDLKKMEEQQMMALAGTEEKIKIVDDMREKSYQQEKAIADLTHQLENEKSLKTKLEEKIEELNKKFQEMEGEQVDLVYREQQLKIEVEGLQEDIKKRAESFETLKSTLDTERKETEKLKLASDDKSRSMDEKIAELNTKITNETQNSQIMVEKLHLREEEIVQLQTALKELEEKLAKETEEFHKLLKSKDDDIVKSIHETSTKDNLIADLKNNLENIQACLAAASSEKNLSESAVMELHQTISQRENSIRELKLQVFSVEKINKEIEDKLNGLTSAKKKFETESELQIADLQEQLQILSDVKEKEVGELSQKYNEALSRISLAEATTTSTESNIAVSQKRENELLLMVKDLELKEAEMSLLNQSLNRRIEELEVMKGVPRKGDAYDQEMQSHIDFLNSIIVDMHKKNLELTNQVEAMTMGGTTTTADSSGNGLDMTFMKKKKPAPRLFCDICDKFDDHETEDCPIQSGSMDSDPPPNPIPKKDRKLPAPRKYCDHCEVFDAHETDECTGADETY